MFRFKLQSVLNYRKALEEKILVEFSEEKKRLEAEKGRLAGMKQEKEALIEQMRAMQAKLFNPSDVALYLSYREVVKEQAVAQENVVREVREEVDVKKGALIEAVTNRKVMDTLKGKRFQEYRDAWEASERKSADETAVLKFVRNEK